MKAEGGNHIGQTAEINMIANAKSTPARLAARVRHDSSEHGTFGRRVNGSGWLRDDLDGEHGPIVIYRHPALRLFVHADRNGVHFSRHDDTRELLPALIWAVRQYVAIAVTGRALSGVESSEVEPKARATPLAQAGG